MKRYSQILFYSVVALWGVVLLELIVRYPCNHGPDSRDMIPGLCECPNCTAVPRIVRGVCCDLVAVHRY